MDGALQPPAPWEDAWVSLRPDEPGYTFDVERNVIIAVFFEKRLAGRGQAGEEILGTAPSEHIRVAITTL